MPAYPDEVLARLGEAVADGGNAELATWAATGRLGIQLLCDIKRGAVKEPWGRVNGRLLADTVPAAFAEIAERFPADFLEVFADARWDRDSDVVAGFGAIDDLGATRHLAAAARSRSKWIRIQAAVGLPSHVSREATDALLQLATDPDWLVREHALNGLQSAGDEHAAAVLKTLPLSDRDRERADAAISAIEKRAALGEAAPGREAERDFLPSEIATIRYAFGAQGEGSPDLTIEGGKLVLQSAAGRVEVTGTPFSTNAGIGVGFRAAVPLKISIGGHVAVGDAQPRALRKVQEAAARSGLRVQWPLETQQNPRSPSSDITSER